MTWRRCHHLDSARPEVIEGPACVLDAQVQVRLDANGEEPCAPCAVRVGRIHH
jgi:hypothetical protein